MTKQVTLDEKLETLIFNLWVVDGRLDKDKLAEAITGIKQTFREAGYVQIRPDDTTFTVAIPGHNKFFKEIKSDA